MPAPFPLGIFFGCFIVPCGHSNGYTNGYKNGVTTGQNGVTNKSKTYKSPPLPPKVEAIKVSF